MGINKKSLTSALTPRLLAIAEMAKDAFALADVGTDHAYIPIYLAKEANLRFALATDINEGPLERAEKNISLYGVKDCIKTRLSDGLDKIESGEADTIVIAGMGGTLIAEILEKGKHIINEDVTFVLQPMTAQNELRKYLYQNGFSITDEVLAIEGRKLYTIIKAQYSGKNEQVDEIFFHIGKRLLEKKDKYALKLIDNKICEFEKIIKGIKSAQENDELAKKKEYCENLLPRLRKLKKECQKW